MRACGLLAILVLSLLVVQPESAPVVAQTVNKAKPKVLHPRKLEDIKKALADIDNTPLPKSDDPLEIERDQALRKVKAYRFLAELPYQNVVLDAEYNKLASAAAALLDKVGEVDHTPANPGLPEKEYKYGYKGASSSNLAGTPKLVASVDLYMDDSDPGNIDRVGQRRGLLNPQMMKTGFGQGAKFSAMYSVDKSQPRVPDFSTICYPARGYMPVEYFKPRYAWSVSLNANKFKRPDPKTVKPNIYEADADGLKTGEALPLDFSKVHSEPLTNVIIFRPAQLDMSPGKRYLVEIEGVVAVGLVSPLTYLVEFVSLKNPYPRKLADIKKALADIDNAPRPKSDDPLEIERDQALRKVKAYRYLAELPYQNVVLDPEYVKLATAAAALLDKIGRLDHTPANPGLPEAEYKYAYKGTSSSNLAGTPRLVVSVDLYMYDSDASNIDRVGHRRWILNPEMMKTGFGKGAKFSAMYSFDKSQPRFPDYSAVCYPVRGYMPVEYLRPRVAWSVSLNAMKFRRPDAKTVKPNIYEADADGLKTGEALKLDYTNVNHEPFGTSHCIIFRPAQLDMSPGKRYVVEIEGVTGVGLVGPFTYLVEFVSLKD